MTPYILVSSLICQTDNTNDTCRIAKEERMNLLLSLILSTSKLVHLVITLHVTHLISILSEKKKSRQENSSICITVYKMHAVLEKMIIQKNAWAFNK